MDLDAKTISKLKNIYISLLDAIMEENIDKVDHFLDDELTSYYRQIIENNKRKNVFQKYDLLNISNIELISETCDEITVSATIKYIDYQLDKKKNRVVSGDDSKRLSFFATLVYRKKQVQDQLVYKCPNCGANLDFNASGICPQCNKPIDERYSEYVLKSISFR